MTPFYCIDTKTSWTRGVTLLGMTGSAFSREGTSWMAGFSCSHLQVGMFLSSPMSSSTDPREVLLPQANGVTHCQAVWPATTKFHAWGKKIVKASGVSLKAFLSFGQDSRKGCG